LPQPQENHETKKPSPPEKKRKKKKRRFVPLNAFREWDIGTLGHTHTYVHNGVCYFCGENGKLAVSRGGKKIKKIKTKVAKCKGISKYDCCEYLNTPRYL